MRQRNLKLWFRKALIVGLLLFSLIPAGVALVCGYIWECCVGGWRLGRELPDEVNDRLQAYWPEKKLND